MRTVVVPATPVSVNVVTNGGTSNTLRVGPATFTGVQGTAHVGTPSNGGQPSANVGQAISILGTDLTANTNVIFPSVDDNGVAGTVNARVSGVSADGTLATVVVPNGASTGNVMLHGATGAFPLQIVPRLTTFSNSDFVVSGASRNLSVNGNGFIEGNMTANYATDSVIDPDTGTNEMDTFSSGTHFNVTIPVNASGMFSVTTPGGSSNTIAVGPTSFTDVQAQAAAGTAADGTQPSANVGQTITLLGSNLRPNTNVIFPTIDTEGVPGQTTVRVNNVSATGQSATVVVPAGAATGNIKLFGVGTTHLLQIVPKLDSFSNTDFRPSGSSRTMALNGGGFIEGGPRYVMGQ